MRKKIYLMTILAMAGMTNTYAQVRIGGSETPNKSAVLDLNPDDQTSEGNATLGLALPRVKLKSCADAYPLSSHVKGMTVYNLATADDAAPGFYTNDGTKWIRQIDSGMPYVVTEKDGVIGNEVVGASDGSLVRSGSGTANSPYSLAVNSGGIETKHLKDGAVTTGKLSNTGLGSNTILMTNASNLWTTQKIPKNPYQVQLSFNNPPLFQVSINWTDTGPSDQMLPAGLYLFTVDISNGNTVTTNALIDCMVLEAGSVAYTIPRKRVEATNTMVLEESFLVFIPQAGLPVRLYLHNNLIVITKAVYNRIVNVYYQPVLQLY